MKRFKSSESKSVLAFRSSGSARSFSSVSQNPGVAKIGKAPSARWTAVPPSPVLMYLAYSRAGCERNGARDASRAKLIVTTKLTGSSNFISDLLSYIYLTQQIFIPTTSLYGADARTDRRSGITQRSLEAPRELAAVFETPKLAIFDSSTRVDSGSNHVSLAKSDCF